MSKLEFKNVDKFNHIPAYYQVKKEIHAKIKNGDIKSGERILSENRLSELFHVSRMTVRKAIDQLVNEGILLREQGKGTFVKKLIYDKIKRDLSELTSLTSDLKRSEHKIITTILKQEIISAPIELASRLEINPGDKIIELARLRQSNGQPIIWEISYIPFKNCPRLIEEDLSGSLFAILEEKFALRVSEANVSLEAILADGYISKILKMKKNQPVIKVEQVTYLIDGRVIQFVKSFSRGDKYKYYIHRKRGNR